jgi:N6-L-threonylcarbamoyladenine synthase
VRETTSRGLILGIESSCDETSAAVLRDGSEVLSNVVASQLIHSSYGGVVPELASREHLRAIVPVVREAMHRAGVTYADLDAVAVTEGPGLAGALLVGITFAKSLAFGAGKPLIAVNHLEGHIHAVLMNSPFGEADPILALVVSGGHTHLYLAHKTAQSTWAYRNVGKTLDDAAGEAFDKVAKLLGLPYPGGPWIDALAAHGDPRAVPFTLAQIKQKANGNTAPKLSRENLEHEDPTRFDMSFSGIKTAVRRHVETHGLREQIAAREAALRAAGLATAKPSDPASLAAALRYFDQATLDLIASFQASVTAALTRTALAAAEHFGARAMLVTGGVAANSELRRRVMAAAAERGMLVAFPTLSLSTDNAAMIAAAAFPKLMAGDFAKDTLEPTPQLRLG